MSLLTKQQKKFLHLFSQEKLLTKRFYLTGGTALIEYYIPYRYSDDLDFFSEAEINIDAVLTFFKSIKKELGYKEFDYNTSYNRNLIFLNFGDYVLKTEFTYFPFPPIQINKPKEGIQIDSLIDIAVNKLFTIYQNPRGRDFMDLYMIQEKENFDMELLISRARAKFDWHVDPLKLGAQFMLAKETKDEPVLVKDLKRENWEDYFIEAAKSLESEIFESKDSQT
ncbi:hypothetical protein GF360_03425 [candidate division WWE3 bacterium]|nr:hypothetical protein [candidate division WWE3 bacterium]